MTDFTFTNHGTLTTLRPNTVAARDWVDEHLPDDAQWFAGAVVVEPRYAGDILDGLQADGLTV